MSDNKPEDGNGGEDVKETPKKKDRWDKASIILKPVGGLLTALAIVFLGFLTQGWLEQTQKKNRDSQLYTELMSKREDSENKLRATMFDKILGILTKPGEPKPTRDETNADRLKRVKNKILNLELITRNFHEFLDVKPIFLDILMDIVQGREKCTKTDPREETTPEERKREWAWQQKRLKQIARRVRQKQLEVLTESGEHCSWSVPLHRCCCDKSIRDLDPNDKCPKRGFDGSRELILTTHQRTNAHLKEISYRRRFSIFVKRAYPKWGMVLVKVTATLLEPVERDRDEDTREFWIGDFDFPLVDNTYLSVDERYAVALDYCNKKCSDEDKSESSRHDPKSEKQEGTCQAVDLDPDKSDKKSGNNRRSPDFRDKCAKIHLVYFPASAAGVKERSFYHQKVIQQLIEESQVIPRKPMRKARTH
jgi:hypothetical protein